MRRAIREIVENSVDRKVVEKRDIEKRKKRLFVDYSTVKQIGNGLFANEDIKQSETIAEYQGEILSKAEIEHKYPGETRAVYVIQNADNESYIDASVSNSPSGPNGEGYFSRTANDCTPNLNRLMVAQLQPECKKNNAEFKSDIRNIFLVATREIKEGEEIWASYGNLYFDQPKEDLPIDEKDPEKKTRIQAAKRDAHYRNSIAMELIKKVLMKKYMQRGHSVFQTKSAIAQLVRKQMEVSLGKRVMNPILQVQRALDAFTKQEQGKDKEEDEFERKRMVVDPYEPERKKQRRQFVYRLKPINYDTIVYAFIRGLYNTEKPTPTEIIDYVKSMYGYEKKLVPLSAKRDISTILEYFPNLINDVHLYPQLQSQYYFIKNTETFTELQKFITASNEREKNMAEEGKEEVQYLSSEAKPPTPPLPPATPLSLGKVSLDEDLIDYLDSNNVDLLSLEEIPVGDPSAASLPSLAPRGPLIGEVQTPEWFSDEIINLFDKPNLNKSSQEIINAISSMFTPKISEDVKEAVVTGLAFLTLNKIILEADGKYSLALPNPEDEVWFRDAILDLFDKPVGDLKTSSQQIIDAIYSLFKPETSKVEVEKAVVAGLAFLTLKNLIRLDAEGKYYLTP